MKALIPSLCFLALTATAVMAQESDSNVVPKGPHNAALESYQMQQLDKLQQKDEAATAYGGIDPSVLQAFTGFHIKQNIGNNFL